MTKFLLTACFAFCVLMTLMKDNISTAQVYSDFATRVTEIDDYRSTSGALGELFARGVTECARECRQIAECISFFYNKQTRLCQLHDIVFVDHGPSLTYVYKTHHYKMNRVVPNFTCPLAPPDAGYNTAVLSDNSVFTYRIVWTLADKVTAETACVTDGAGLVKVLSLTKMQTLVNLFTTCPGYVYAGDYWIDGSNINAADFFDIAEWSTSDSEPLPTTDQFWAPERPLDPDIHHCVALWAADDYQWANLPCTYTNYYICEK